MSGLNFEITHDKDFFVLEGTHVEAWFDGQFDTPAYVGHINDAPARVTDVLLAHCLIKRK
jgi:hypothetical protein